MDLLFGFGALDLVVALGVALLVLWFVLSTANKNVTSVRSGGLRNRAESGGHRSSLVGAPSRAVLDKVASQPAKAADCKAYGFFEHGSYGVVQVPKHPEGCAVIFLLVWLFFCSLFILFGVALFLGFITGKAETPMNFFILMFCLIWISVTVACFSFGATELLSVALIGYARRLLVVSEHGLTFFIRLGPLKRRIDIAREDLRLTYAGGLFLAITGAPKDLVFLTQSTAESENLSDFIMRHAELDDSRLTDDFPSRPGKIGVYIGTDNLLGGIMGGNHENDGGSGGGDFGGGDFGGGGGGGGGGGDGGGG